MFLPGRSGPGRRAADFPALDEACAAGRTWRQKTLWVVPAIRIILFVLLVFSLARPCVVRAEIPILPEGIDIVVVVDRSSSMGALSEGRAGERSTLDLLKEAAGDFVRARGNDRIALVAFSRTPETLFPFTLDEAALAARLDRIEAVEPGSEEDGTAIGAGLAEAARLFTGTENGEGGGDSREKGRVVILFTDGEENRFVVEPLRAARLCVGLGVRVHTVSLDFGEEKIDGALNDRIAAITGGCLFRVSAPGDLAGTLAALDSMEKTPIEGRSFSLREDRYLWFLIPAFLLAIAGFLLSRTVYGRVP
jgi:Ca-activated chloride channel homolog